MIHPNPPGASPPTYSEREFLFNGQTSRETRADALASSQHNAPKRRSDVLEAFRRAGSAGLTRNELADVLAVPPNHITRTVLDLIRENELIETGARRSSRWGRDGAVLVLAGFVTHDIGPTSE